jgi:prevent-host-death family protein
MKKVTIHQAKTNLSKLLVAVEGGEEVLISRGGSPVAKLTSVKSAHPKRTLGKYQGQFKVPENFDKPLPKSILKYFE